MKIAIEHYLNQDASVFLSRLPSDQERDWAWMVIEEIRRRFPNADHWTTGGENKSYVDIRIGVKDSNKVKKRGVPKLYLYYQENTLHCMMHRDFLDENGLRVVTTPDQAPTRENLAKWFDEVERRLSEAGIQLDGEGRSPVDYATEINSEHEESDEGNSRMKTASIPLNQILYGPPGTGKTYAVVNAALEILDPIFWVQHKEQRQKLKTRFDELGKEGRLRFVTFHQSFSYEDFVEGLCAQTTQEGQIEYKIEDGVFKQLCDAARGYANRINNPAVGETPRVWKISIDGTGASATRDYCLNNGEARIGSGDTGDMRERVSPNPYFDALGSNDKNTLLVFTEEIAVGDILLCIHSATQIGAVGVVTGPYRFEAQPPASVREDYKHVLPVQWLYKDLSISVLPINDNTRFTQKTVYPLDRFSWGDLLAHLDKAEAKPSVMSAKVMNGDGLVPHVLIIDEINRGNVSRIFGELITLIEESKRGGKPESLDVSLPYSKRPFSVPNNVYIIGTMNTADRSLAGLDIALRRRFSFKEMPPRPDLLDELVIAETQINVGHMLRIMNQRIAVLLDRDHCLGHAYFMPLLEDGKNSLERLAGIVQQNIIPLLQEYFFEDWERIRWVLNDHEKSSEQHCFIVKDRALDTQKLFGSASVGTTRGVWRLNREAFNYAQSYEGIGQAGPMDDEVDA